mgnify:FL=1|jgi:hypothetical protein|tara:strand:+ start:11805 stop:12551 length:747 start_codon:yes stop_codon:yes gene_type:complete
MKTKKKVYTDKQYRLTQAVAPLAFMLPTRNSKRFPLMHFDEETGINRSLRYASNQKSPFEDEQDGNALLTPIIFEDGFLHVAKENQILQEFLHYHPLLGMKFAEVNAAKDAAAEVEDLMIEADALIEAKSLSLDQLETVCRVLFNKDTTKVSTAELKRDILVYAKNYPSDFMEVISDPELKMQGTVQQFFDRGFLAFRKSNKEVWFATSTNKTKLLNVPYGQNGMDLVVSHLKSDDGLEVLKYLESLL